MPARSGCSTLTKDFLNNVSINVSNNTQHKCQVLAAVTNLSNISNKHHEYQGGMPARSGCSTLTKDFLNNTRHKCQDCQAATSTDVPQQRHNTSFQVLYLIYLICRLYLIYFQGAHSTDNTFHAQNTERKECQCEYQYWYRFQYQRGLHLASTSMSASTMTTDQYQQREYQYQLGLLICHFKGHHIP